MTALYLHEDVKELLAGKTLVVIGDSVERSVYKDLVCLLQENRYLTDGELRKKGELSFIGDELIYGGVKGEQKNSINYRECRYFRSEFEACCRYYFVTICYSEYVETILQELSLEPTDIIVMNSCLWDVHRHGKTGIDKYEENLESLVLAVRRLLPDCLFLWLTTPPVHIKSKGGFLMHPGTDLVKIQEVKYCNEIAREVFTAANKIYGTFRIVDLDYVFQYFEHHRASDGVHWNERAHRRMSNMILEELSKVYNKKVPRVLDDSSGKLEREFLPPQQKNNWADDIRSDFWNLERPVDQNGWNFDTARLNLPQPVFQSRGFPFPPNVSPVNKFGLGPAIASAFNNDLRLIQPHLINDLDDLGHARKQVESLVESRKRKRSSTDSASDKPPEKQYRFGVTNTSTSNSLAVKRKAEDSSIEPCTKIKIVEVDGVLKKLVNLGDGVTIHLALNKKEREAHQKELADNAKKTTKEVMTEGDENALKSDSKINNKDANVVSVRNDKMIEEKVDDKKPVREENTSKGIPLLNKTKVGNKRKDSTTTIRNNVSRKDVDSTNKESAANQIDVSEKGEVEEDKKEIEAVKEVISEENILGENKRKNVVVRGKVEVEESNAESSLQGINESLSDEKAGKIENNEEARQKVDILNATPLKEAMKNISDLPLVSSVPKEKKKKKELKDFVPRRSPRISKVASRMLNLIKNPVGALIDKVPETSQKPDIPVSVENKKLPVTGKDKEDSDAMPTKTDVKDIETSFSSAEVYIGVVKDVSLKTSGELSSTSDLSLNLTYLSSSSTVRTFSTPCNLNTKTSLCSVNSSLQTSANITVPVFSTRPIKQTDRVVPLSSPELFSQPDTISMEAKSSLEVDMERGPTDAVTVSTTKAVTQTSASAALSISSKGIYIEMNNSENVFNQPSKHVSIHSSISTDASVNMTASVPSNMQASAVSEKQTVAKSFSDSLLISPIHLSSSSQHVSENSPVITNTLSPISKLDSSNINHGKLLDEVTVCSDKFGVAPRNKMNIFGEERYICANTPASKNNELSSRKILISVVNTFTSLGNVSSTLATSYVNRFSVSSNVNVLSVMSTTPVASTKISNVDSKSVEVNISREMATTVSNFGVIASEKGLSSMGIFGTVNESILVTAATTANPIHSTKAISSTKLITDDFLSESSASDINVSDESVDRNSSKKVDTITALLSMPSPFARLSKRKASASAISTATTVLDSHLPVLKASFGVETSSSTKGNILGNDRYAFNENNTIGDDKEAMNICAVVCQAGGGDAPISSSQILPLFSNASLFVNVSATKEDGLCEKSANPTVSSTPTLVNVDSTNACNSEERKLLDSFPISKAPISILGFTNLHNDKTVLCKSVETNDVTSVESKSSSVKQTFADCKSTIESSEGLVSHGRDNRLTKSDGVNAVSHGVSNMSESRNENVEDRKENLAIKGNKLTESKPADLSPKRMSLSEDVNEDLLLGETEVGDNLSDLDESILEEGQTDVTVTLIHSAPPHTKQSCSTEPIVTCTPTTVIVTSAQINHPRLERLPSLPKTLNSRYPGNVPGNIIGNSPQNIPNLRKPLHNKRDMVRNPQNIPTPRYPTHYTGNFNRDPHQSATVTRFPPRHSGNFNGDPLQNKAFPHFLPHHSGEAMRIQHPSGTPYQFPLRTAGDAMRNPTQDIHNPRFSTRSNGGMTGSSHQDFPIPRFIQPNNSGDIMKQSILNTPRFPVHGSGEAIGNAPLPAPINQFGVHNTSNVARYPHQNVAVPQYPAHSKSDVRTGSIQNKPNQMYYNQKASAITDFSISNNPSQQLITNKAVTHPVQNTSAKSSLGKNPTPSSHPVVEEREYSVASATNVMSCPIPNNYTQSFSAPDTAVSKHPTLFVRAGDSVIQDISTKVSDSVNSSFLNSVLNISAVHSTSVITTSTNSIVNSTTISSTVNSSIAEPISIAESTLNDSKTEKKKLKKYPNETREEKRLRRQLKRERKEQREKRREEKKKAMLAQSGKQVNVSEENSNLSWNKPLDQIADPQRVRSATWAPPYHPNYDDKTEQRTAMHKRLAPPDNSYQRYNQSYQVPPVSIHPPVSTHQPHPVSAIQTHQVQPVSSLHPVSTYQYNQPQYAVPGQTFPMQPDSTHHNHNSTLGTVVPQHPKGISQRIQHKKGTLPFQSNSNTATQLTHGEPTYKNVSSIVNTTLSHQKEVSSLKTHSNDASSQQLQAKPIETIYKPPSTPRNSAARMPYTSKHAFKKGVSHSSPSPVINTPNINAHVMNPYQSLHLYQQPQQNVIQEPQASLLTQQQLTSHQVGHYQQQPLLQPSSNIVNQSYVAHDTNQRQLYIDEYGQTYTLEEETYIVGPSGQIQNISSATNAYLQQQQQQQQLQQQPAQQHFTIQPTLLYADQQTTGYL